MGRGRAKAKQTKVARRLKYNTPDMDLDSLQRELAGKNTGESAHGGDSYSHDNPDAAAYEDPYADYAEWDDDTESRVSGDR